MKRMQIYVSMPSFNISESKDWHRTRAQLDAVCVCVCVFLGASGCMHSHTCVCKGVCALWALGIVCVCLRPCLLFRDAAVLWSKDEAQRENGEKKKRGGGAKPLFSKEKRLLVGDAALIRRTVAVDNRDHRGQSVNSNRTSGDLQSVLSRKRRCILLLYYEARKSNKNIATGEAVCDDRNLHYMFYVLGDPF